MSEERKKPHEESVQSFREAMDILFQNIRVEGRSSPSSSSSERARSHLGEIERLLGYPTTFEYRSSGSLHERMRRVFEEDTPDPSRSPLYSYLMPHSSSEPETSRILQTALRAIHMQLNAALLRIQELERQSAASRRADIETVEAIEALLDKQEHVEDELYTQLASFSLGLYSEEAKIRRYLPINIYLSNASLSKEAEITSAISDLCNAIGLEIVKEYPAIAGSLFKNFFAKTKDVVSQPEVLDRLKKVERAIELETIHTKQAEVDKNQAEAVKSLLESLTDTPNAVVQIGSLLVIKLTDEEQGVRVITKSLDHLQIALLDQNPQLLTQPQAILGALARHDRQPVGGPGATEMTGGKLPDHTMKPAVEQ